MWANMLQVYNGVLESATQENDKVLFLTPSYYRLIVQAKHKKRRCLEVELVTKDHRLWIDFEALE